MKSQHPLAIVGQVAALLLGITLLAVATVAARYLLFEESHGDPQHIHTLLDKVLP